MPTEISLLRRCRDQEIAIARLMEESQLLRDENANLLAELDAARGPLRVADGVDRPQALPAGAAAPATAPCQLSLVANRIGRLEATLPVSPTAPVTARTTLTRWLSGHVPLDVLEGARQLASELVSNSLLRPDISEDDLLRLAVELREGSLRVEVRDPGTTDVVAGPEPAPDCERGGEPVLQLVDEIATRWGINRTGGTQVWFEVDAALTDTLG